MLAPDPVAPALLLVRVRCACHQDALVVHPAAWYPHQESTTTELPCPACGRSLRPMQIPVGAEARAWTPAQMPSDVAAAISPELAGEVAEAQETPVAAGGDLSWSRRHEASAEYTRWVESRPAPLPLDRSAQIEAAVATAAFVLVAVVAASF